VAFFGSGFAFANWASRIPQVRAHLHLTPEHLGLVLLCIAAGAVVALPLAGPVVHRLGSRRTVAATAALLTIGLGTVAIGYAVGVVAVVIGLFVFGVANGAWDVAMNVQGALVERHVGRSIMSRFHAGYSLGTVIGALTGAGMVALHVSVVAHFMAVAVSVGAVVLFGTRGFLADATGVISGTAPRPQVRSFAAWREPRTLMVGLFVLAFAFAEGTGNDWLSLATIGSYHVPAVVGTLAYSAFLSAMTLGRWFGPGLLDRFGRVVVLRMLVFARLTSLAFVGAIMWGIGISLGFPVGMSAGADEPQSAAGRVSVIASIGYCAFLAGPPSVGLLGQHLGVLNAITTVAILLGIALLLAPAISPPTREPETGSDRRD
jgi:MFS family permease